MRKSTIKLVIREVNEKIVRLKLEQTILILSKPLELDDSNRRSFESKEWDIYNHIKQLKIQKRALLNIMGIL